VTGSKKKFFEKEEWLIELDFNTIKSFFDPIFEQIIKLIDFQLRKSSGVSVMFLIGGFSDSKYLQSRIKQKFVHRVNRISGMKSCKF